MPAAIAVIALLEEDGVEMVAEPEINDQLPVPTAGKFPAKVAVVEQIV